MNTTCLYLIGVVLLFLVCCASTYPVTYQDDWSLQRSGGYEESRVFHPLAIKKRKKKKLLQCLLNLQRQNPQVDARTLFFNYVNLEYTENGGDHNGAYNDEEGENGGGNGCLSQFTSGNGGGGGGGFGEGINHLGSLVGQVGQAPGNLISSVGEGIKPVFESPERYLNRYIIRPLYRSLRPFYRLF